MHDGDGGRAAGRRAVMADFPPALVKRVAGTVRRILRDAPPGKDGPPYSPELTRYAVKTFAEIVIHSINVGLAHHASRRRRER
jgi:hypothetical protein